MLLHICLVAASSSIHSRIELTQTTWKTESNTYETETRREECRFQIVINRYFVRAKARTVVEMRAMVLRQIKIWKVSGNMEHPPTRKGPLLPRTTHDGGTLRTCGQRAFHLLRKVPIPDKLLHLKLPNVSFLPFQGGACVRNPLTYQCIAVLVQTHPTLPPRRIKAVSGRWIGRGTPHGRKHHGASVGWEVERISIWFRTCTCFARIIQSIIQAESPAGHRDKQVSSGSVDPHGGKSISGVHGIEFARRRCLQRKDENMFKNALLYYNVLERTV